MKHILFILVFAMSIVSCRNKTDNSVRLIGKEYYNNKIGSWIIYRVDSIVFSDFNTVNQKIDTFNYQVKEILTEKFLNSSGKETNRIERFKRLQDTLPWDILNVWTSNLSDKGLEKVEENIRFSKMSFPITENKVWPGNQYNTLPPWDYTYRGVDKPQTLNGYTFDHTVTVIQKDSTENNFIEQRFAREIYAKDVGMVYKQIDTLEIQNLIKKGLYFRQTAIDWSK